MEAVMLFYVALMLAFFTGGGSGALGLNGHDGTKAEKLHSTVCATSSAHAHLLLSLEICDVGGFISFGARWQHVWYTRKSMIRNFTG